MFMAALMLLAQSMSGPASAKTIKYYARMSAKYPAVAAGKSLAIANFSGPDGENFTNVLSSTLQAAQLDGRPVFDIRTVDRVIYRSKANLSKVEIANLVRTGQQVNAATVFMGSVTSATITSTKFNRQGTVCLRSSGPFKCEQSTTKTIPCLKVSGNYSVAPRAVRVSDGAIVFSENIVVQGEFTSCDGQLLGSDLTGIIGTFVGSQGNSSPNVSPYTLLDKLRRDAAEKIRQFISPYNREVSVNLKERSSGFSKADNAQFQNAIAFGNALRMDRACSIFETLHAAPANVTNVALLYNMGVCQEVLLPDEPSAALEYYAKADQLLSRPDKQVSDAYIRMKAIVGQSRTIK